MEYGSKKHFVNYLLQRIYFVNDNNYVICRILQAFICYFCSTFALLIMLAHVFFHLVMHY